MYLKLQVSVILTVTLVGNIWADDLGLKVGDQLAIKMTGEAAKAYSIATGAPDTVQASQGLSTEILGTVAQRLTDGRFQVQHLSNVRQKDKSERLVTLTAIVRPEKVQTKVTPKGTMVYASPKSTVASVTTQSSSFPQIELDDLGGVRLQTWSLMNEVGGN
jgi:hypothetical protein